jgi:hypothetical protein
MKGAVLVPLIGLAVATVSAQTLEVRLEGCPNVSLLHAHRVHPVSGHRMWFNVALVDDGEAAFELNPREGEVWVMESPPWMWELTTRENERNRAVLTCPSDVPMRMRKVFGSVAWEALDGGVSDHPQPVIEAIQDAHFQELRALEYDLLSATGAVGQRASLVEDTVWHGANRRMAEKFAAVQSEAPWAQDAVLRERVRWAVATGQPDSMLFAMLAEYLDETPRQTCELLASHNWVDAVEIALQLWWQDLDGTELEAALAAGEVPDLGPIGKFEALRPWAWWVLAQSQPRSRLVARALAQGGAPDCILEAHRQLIVPPVSVPPEHWTTRSGELESIQEFCEGRRTVLLVVKAGSTAALRERQLFAQIAESNPRRDVEFVVVSIDGTEAGWKAVQADRASRQENVRWVGNDPRALETWNISTVPQVVVLGPDGDALPRQRLPSEGLATDIERWPR